jgi:hypothetical protein
MRSTVPKYDESDSDVVVVPTTPDDGDNDVIVVSTEPPFDLHAEPTVPNFPIFKERK